MLYVQIKEKLKGKKLCDWDFYISMMCFTEIDMAVTAFAELQELDPYRLENMDTYSNLLYIKVSACKLNFRNLIWYDLWSKMAVITISRNFKWQKKKDSAKIFLWNLEVKLKTRWVITGSWEPLVNFFLSFMFLLSTWNFYALLKYTTNSYSVINVILSSWLQCCSYN